MAVVAQWLVKSAAGLKWHVSLIKWKYIGQQNIIINIILTCTRFEPILASRELSTLAARQIKIEERNQQCGQ